VHIGEFLAGGAIALGAESDLEADASSASSRLKKCGIQPAHQSLATDVFGSCPLRCAINRVTHPHAGTSRTLCLTWAIRMWAKA